jgi:quaternary ammonium compound-resistance protein SugE
MSWIYLLIAGILEILWSVCLKYCDGFKLGIPLGLTVSGALLSMVFLGLAIKEIPISIAYAIWCAIGVIGIAVYGIIFLGESTNITKIIFLLMILVGVIGLKVTTN